MLEVRGTLVLVLKKMCLNERFFISMGTVLWFSSVQLLSCVRLYDPIDCSTPGLLSFTNSQSLLKLISIKSVRPSNHLILCCPPSPPVFHLSQHQGLFQWLSSSHQVAKALEFQFQHQSFQWMGWLDFLAVQETLKSLQEQEQREPLWMNWSCGQVGKSLSVCAAEKQLGWWIFPEIPPYWTDDLMTPRMFTVCQYVKSLRLSDNPKKNTSLSNSEE